MKKLMFYSMVFAVVMCICNHAFADTLSGQPSMTVASSQSYLIATGAGDHFYGGQIFQCVFQGGGKWMGTQWVQRGDGSFYSFVVTVQGYSDGTCDVMFTGSLADGTYTMIGNSSYSGQIVLLPGGHGDYARIWGSGWTTNPYADFGLFGDWSGLGGTVPSTMPAASRPGTDPSAPPANTMPAITGRLDAQRDRLSGWITQLTPSGMTPGSAFAALMSGYWTDYPTGSLSDETMLSMKYSDILASFRDGINSMYTTLATVFAATRSGIVTIIPWVLGVYMAWRVYGELQALRKRGQL
ncbi:MAG: hypothetical protein WCI73_18120 [Phycisphaerae bacterium]